MNGQYKGFRFLFGDDTLIILSAEPQIGELKRYPLNGGMPEIEDEAMMMASGRIDMDFDELSYLELNHQ